jgi:zinc transporter, ZIP family
MTATMLEFIAIAGGAALCSPLGGLATILMRPSSLLLSIMAGLAGGVLLSAIAFEMMPEALELASLLEVTIGFVVGLAAVYGFDLYVHRGAIAGPEASQRSRVQRFHAWHKPLGDKVTVLAGATSAEEVVEGIVIGVSATIAGGMGLVVGIAIAIDNISEAMSIGEMVGNRKGGGDDGAKRAHRKVLGWTSLIGVSLFVSACAGWFLLKALPADWLGFLSAAGAGAIFYLAVTNLLPEAESHQYQQSSGLAAAAGFLAILLLTEFT